MRTIGLIGGMSWESTAAYYRLINQAVNRSLGGHHNARSLMLSVDFADIETLQRAGDWDELGRHMSEAARQLEQGGAELLILCTNTMHLVADRISSAVGIPFLHIADATGRQLRADGVQCAGLLGTRFTMEHQFYRMHLSDHFGLSVVTPAEHTRAKIHQIIYDELCHGRITEPSRLVFQLAIAEMREQGAQAVILGCTEIGLLIQPEHSSLPVYDTTVLHAEAAVALALSPRTPV